MLNGLVMTTGFPPWTLWAMRAIMHFALGASAYASVAASADCESAIPQTDVVLLAGGKPLASWTDLMATFMERASPSWDVPGPL